MSENNKIASETNKPPVASEKPAEKPKLSRWERTKNFWNIKKRLTPMFLDYKRVAIDFSKDFPKNKLYYSSRIALTSAFLYAIATVPTKEDHSRKILTEKHKMITYGTNRNPLVNNYVQKM